MAKRSPKTMTKLQHVEAAKRVAEFAKEELNDVIDANVLFHTERDEVLKLIELYKSLRPVYRSHPKAVAEARSSASSNASKVFAAVMTAAIMRWKAEQPWMRSHPRVCASA